MFDLFTRGLVVKFYDLSLSEKVQNLFITIVKHKLLAGIGDFKLFRAQFLPIFALRGGVFVDLEMSWLNLTARLILSKKNSHSSLAIADSEE